MRCPVHLGDTPLVEDVEGVTESPVQVSPHGLIEAPDGTSVQTVPRNGYQAVAVDCALIAEPLRGPDLDLRSDSSDRTGHRSADDRGKDGGNCVPGEHAHWTATRRRAEIGPVDLGPRYHSGTV